MAAELFGRFPVARTADVDEAQEAMRSTFLPLDLRPLEPVGSGGGLDLGLNATRARDVTVTYVRFGRGVQIDTAGRWRGMTSSPSRRPCRPGLHTREPAYPRAPHRFAFLASNSGELWNSRASSRKRPPCGEPPGPSPLPLAVSARGDRSPGKLVAGPGQLQALRMCSSVRP